MTMFSIVSCLNANYVREPKKHLSVMLRLPEPQCILCFDSQIADMERFLSSSSDVHGILTVDPTYNLGEFYVTPTTYPHLMLEDGITGKPPSLLGDSSKDGIFNI